MSFAEEEVVYRDLAGPWGSYRLIVGGKDVTDLRGKPAQIGNYQLTEPYGYGPASFSLPPVTSLEVDKFGTGDLAWLKMGANVRLIQVNAAGERVRVVWRGFITAWTPRSEGLDLHCDGQASGRLALRDKHPELFVWFKDAGHLLWGAFRKVGLTTFPQRGLETGILLDERGRAGSMLSYCDGILADAQGAGGRQLTVMPRPDGVYVQRWKDRTTVHATIHNGAAGVDVDVTRDLSEEPTTIYGSGRNPESGMVWVNGKYPGLMQAPAPPFPGRMEEGDTGQNVRVLQSKLIGMGYLDKEDADGTFNSDVTDAVIDLQADAGLAETGIVNQRTWESLFDLEDTGLSLRNAHQAPLRQLPAVRKRNFTSNGSVAGFNPNYDPTRIEVDRTVDFGNTKKSRARKWAKRELERVQTGKNWTGVIELRTDVAKGTHTHGATPTQMSRLDLDAGQNILVRNFDGSTLFHVAGVTVNSDLSVRLAVDTKARDLLHVGQIIERNRASRTSPARAWLRERRGTDANHRIVEFSEVGGRVWSTIECDADKWTVFPVIAGQSGSVQRIRVKVTDSKCEFVVAAFAKRVGRAYLADKIGNPFHSATGVQNISLNAQGSGYTSAPKVTLNGGGGRGAKAEATISGGKVIGVRLTQAGHGYTSAPSVSFSGGGGSGASASATLRQTGNDRWASDRIADLIDRERILLGAWGDEEQPGGYFGGSKTNEDGERSNDPLTGVLLDDGGFDYHTFGQPVIWMAVYPKQACKIEPQRVMWPVLEAGM